MTDTPVNLAALLASLADGQQGTVTAAKFRVLCQSINTIFEVWNTPSYADEAAAIAGGVPSHGWYRNGNIVQVRLT